MQEIIRTASLWGGLSLLFVILIGCSSTPQTRQLLAETDQTLPGQVELKEVPFYAQERYQCGPAALATSLNWAGVDIGPEALKDEIYLPERKGSLQLELLAASRRHGRIAYPIEPDLKSLLTEVAAGNPVLVLQNLGLSWTPTWHFAVVVGYELSAAEVILRSGTRARHRLSLATFERTWARGDYWGIVVLRPDQLPARAEEKTYLEAVVMLEKVQRWPEAQQAYQTALAAWPGNLLAQMGLGNSAYYLQDLAAARHAFESAVVDHPDAADAHNNLAQVLLELGQLELAREHAETAVSLGGAHLPHYQATLLDIKRAQAASAVEN